MFDYLPLDVINFVIRPFIANDYWARVSLNSLLPPAERQGTRFKVDTLKQVELFLAMNKLRVLVDKATDATDPNVKAEKIVEFFDFLIKHPLFLQHSLSLRNTVFNQASTFGDITCPQYNSVNTSTMVVLVNKASEMLSVLKGKPFLYHITSLNNTTWCPIDGVGKRVCVDNELALIAAAAAEKLRLSTPHWRNVRPEIRYYRHRIGYDDYEHDYYEDENEGEWEYGYFDASNKWVFIKDDTPPKVSRRGTVMEDDGWEKVVSKKGW